MELLPGFHAITAALEDEHLTPGTLFYNKERDDARLGELLTLAENRGVKTKAVERKTLEMLLPGKSHQGVVLELSGLRYFDETWLQKKLGETKLPLLVALDGITDAGNFGACLRSCEAAGVDAVLIPKDRSAGLSADVYRASAGAASRVPVVRVTNLGRSLEILKEKGIWAVGAAGDAPITIYKQDYAMPMVLVMGSEDKGMREGIRSKCDFLAKIPMQGKIQSLNVSVAMAIMLYEVQRQRGKLV